MKRLLISFRFAISGLVYALQKEKNLQIHLLAFGCVISAGFYVSLRASDWVLVLLTSALVITLELVNTSLEKICDFISPQKNEKIKIIKDTAAAAVLVAAAFAFIIACIVFFPYLFTQE